MGRRVHRCSFLDQDEKQCPRAGVITSHFFGDPEFVPRWPTWVRVYWCPLHAPDAGGLKRARKARLAAHDAAREGDER